MTRLQRTHTEADREMSFSDARRSKEDDVLSAIDEGERFQMFDNFAVERRLRIEVERVKALEHGEVRELRTNGNASLLPCSQFVCEQMIDELQWREVSLRSSLNMRLKRTGSGC